MNPTWLESLLDKVLQHTFHFCPGFRRIKIWPSGKGAELAFPTRPYLFIILDPEAEMKYIHAIAPCQARIQATQVPFRSASQASCTPLTGMNSIRFANIVTLLYLLKGAVRSESTALESAASPLSLYMSRIKRQCCAACTPDNCSCGGCPGQQGLMKQVFCPEHCQPLCTNSCVMNVVTCPDRCQPHCTNACLMNPPPPPPPAFPCSAQCMPRCEASCIAAPPPMVVQPICDARCMPTCSPQCIQTYTVQTTCVQACMPMCQPACVQAMEVRQVTTCVDACMPSCQPACVQAVACSSCTVNCPSICAQPVCVQACMPRCLPTCIQAVQVQPRPPAPMVPCSPGCMPSCSPLCMQQTCPPQCLPSCTPSCMQQFATQLSPTRICATECMPACEATCLAQVTCAPSCMPACAPSCVAVNPAPPPPPPPAPQVPAAVPFAGPTCVAPCMPSCLPTCIQQVQTAQIAVPCGNPCICQPGYVQCAETMCCLKYKNMAVKFRRLKEAAKNRQDHEQPLQDSPMEQKS
ncbi:hypothetical protein Y032_0123g1131 [Ancylostoma ceylanicum]|uniref:Cysteine rich repeat-containing domain protein n=1 Tax=Ancylostoma ceylanicum TaxID=53326 RepID=A0A016T9K2_9BILA|nr:hypothetical protein Y032_0123g1131 [Ancylostoma ceylanicum]